MEIAVYGSLGVLIFILSLGALGWWLDKRMAKRISSGFDETGPDSFGPILDIRKTRVSSSDVLIVRYPEVLHINQIQRLKSILEESFPENRIVVLAGGADLSVIEKQEESEPEHTEPLQSVVFQERRPPPPPAPPPKDYMAG